MRHCSRLVVFALMILLVTPAAGWATSVVLNAVTYPERKVMKLDFVGTERAPDAEVSARVEFRGSQAKVELEFNGMKPAVLFGGDVTCYVVWAVSRDGSFSNLGEWWMPDNKGNVSFSTGRKIFALLVTAESYGRVRQPSELVVMYNLAADSKNARSEPFEFSGFAKAPAHQLDSIRNVAWDSNTPLDLMQAEKAYELAQRHGADQYAEGMMGDAYIALSQARNLEKKNKTRLDYSRRSIELASEAIQVTERRKEAEELERLIAERREEMAGLEQRAAEAEEKSNAAREALELANIAISEANEQQSAAEASVLRTQAELARIAEEKSALQLEQAAMLSSLESMREESARLRKEREELSNRLEGALSQVAETHDSARGMIVNLPDILFDLNKAELKGETKIVIAKLAGILLIMPELNVRVEGHTDATGGDEHNLKLSKERALSVSTFLETQGIASGRLQAVGYGKTKPVADNETAEGRQKNRRVEIIIAQGEITEGAATEQE